MVLSLSVFTFLYFGIVLTVWLSLFYHCFNQIMVIVHQHLTVFSFIDPTKGDDTAYTNGKMTKNQPVVAADISS